MRAGNRVGEGKNGMLSRREFLLALACAVLTAGSANASARDLQAVDVIQNEEVLYNPATVGTDPLYKLSSSDPRVQRTALGLEPEQVRSRHRNFVLRSCFHAVELAVKTVGLNAQMTMLALDAGFGLLNF